MSSDVLERLGRFTYRARWAVIVLWLCVVSVAAIFAPRVNGVLHGGGYTIGNSESVVAYNSLHKAYGYNALTFSVVITAQHGREQLALLRAREFRSRATARFGSTLTVSPPVELPSNGGVVERIYSKPQDDFGAHFAGPLRAMLPHGAVHGNLTGPPAIFHDMESVSNEDLQRVEIVTLPLAAAVLILIFGTLVASALPVLMAPVAVTLALALIYAIGHRVNMSIFVLNTASMLGLGVAIDYSLFMVSRFREELALGHDLETAVGRTVATSGRSILVSALVVSVGFYALTLSGVQMLESLGIGGSVVTIVSLLVAITMLPAMLGILGHRVNLVPIMPGRISVRSIWHSIAVWVMRRPIGVIAIVAVIITALAAPAFHLRAGIPGPEILPPSVDSRAGNDVLNRYLGYANHSPILVTVERKPGTSPSTAQATALALIARVCRSDDVVGLSSVPVPNSPSQLHTCQQTLQTLRDSTPGQLARQQAARAQSVGLISVFLRSDPSSAGAERFVTYLRQQPAIPGYRILVGGQTAGQMDFNNFLYSRFPLVILFVIVTIYLILLIAFRSLLLPLKAVLMNVFSILAAYGVAVFAFQDGHLAKLLDFTVVGNIDSIVPVFLFCVLFGLSTDYEVFLLSRVQEHYRATGNNEESVAMGLETTGQIITSAAAVMVVVFGAFAFARLVVIKEIGLGLALAVLVDATVIRALLVPATMRLLGRWNWWMPFRGFRTSTSTPTIAPPSKIPAAE